MASDYEVPSTTAPSPIANEVDTDESRIASELANLLENDTALSSVGDRLARHLRRLFPVSLYVYYAYDRDRDELVATHASGNAAVVVMGHRVTPGQRLTGWVAASRKTIANSDPTLDFGQLMESIKPRPRSCLSTPLVANNSLVGVLSLYSTPADAFTASHVRLIEKVAELVAPTFLEASDNFDPSRSETAQPVR